MAIPTAAAAAAFEAHAAADRTTALPAAAVVQPPPPTDGTVALPAEGPEKPPARKVEPKFKPRGVAPSAAPQAAVVEVPAPAVAAPRVERPTAKEPVQARPKPTPWVLIGGVAALVVVVAAVIALWPKGGPPAGGDAGTVVINAVPWAQVESIVNADDTPQPLAGSSYTPLAVELPPGRYRIVLRNPSKSDPQVVETDVKAGETSRAPVADFRTVEVSTVLEKYGL
jgi:hypothetical protein